MMPEPQGSEKLTGASRYRDGWFGRLVLQVEENVRGSGPGRPTYVVGTRWRDATVRDLYAIEWINCKSAPPPSRDA